MASFLEDLFGRRLTDRENILARAAELGRPVRRRGRDRGPGPAPPARGRRLARAGASRGRARRTGRIARDPRRPGAGRLVAVAARALARHAQRRSRRLPPGGRLRPPRAAGGAAQLHAHRGPQPPHPGSGGPAPRGGRGPAGGERGRGARRERVVVRGDRGPTACCCPRSTRIPPNLRGSSTRRWPRWRPTTSSTRLSSCAPSRPSSPTRQRRPHRERLFTHRHTIRYRLDRARELTGLDVSSTDGRERLSLGSRRCGCWASWLPAARRTSGARGGPGPLAAERTAEAGPGLGDLFRR